MNFNNGRLMQRTFLKGQFTLLKILLILGMILPSLTFAITLVGKQSKFDDAVAEVIEMHYAILDSYEAAVDLISSSEYSKKLEGFVQEHKHQIDKFSEVLKAHDATVPEHADMAKDLITTGKVKIASLVSEKTILSALEGNEKDVITAYNRMKKRKDKWSGTHKLFVDGYDKAIARQTWLKIQSSS